MVKYVPGRFYLNQREVLLTMVPRNSSWKLTLLIVIILYPLPLLLLLNSTCVVCYKQFVLDVYVTQGTKDMIFILFIPELYTLLQSLLWDGVNTPCCLQTAWLWSANPSLPSQLCCRGGISNYSLQFVSKAQCRVGSLLLPFHQADSYNIIADDPVLQQSTAAYVWCCAPGIW